MEVPLKWPSREIITLTMTINISSTIRRTEAITNTRTTITSEGDFDHDDREGRISDGLSTMMKTKMKITTIMTAHLGIIAGGLNMVKVHTASATFTENFYSKTSKICFPNVVEMDLIQGLISTDLRREDLISAHRGDRTDLMGRLDQGLAVHMDPLDLVRVDLTDPVQVVIIDHTDLDPAVLMMGLIPVQAVLTTDLTPVQVALMSQQARVDR